MQPVFSDIGNKHNLVFKHTAINLFGFLSIHNANGSNASFTNLGG